MIQKVSPSSKTFKEFPLKRPQRETAESRSWSATIFNFIYILALSFFSFDARMCTHHANKLNLACLQFELLSKSLALIIVYSFGGWKNTQKCDANEVRMTSRCSSFYCLSRECDKSSKQQNNKNLVTEKLRSSHDYDVNWRSWDVHKNLHSHCTIIACNFNFKSCHWRNSPQRHDTFYVLAYQSQRSPQVRISAAFLEVRFCV